MHHGPPPHGAASGVEAPGLRIRDGSQEGAQGCRPPLSAGARPCTPATGDRETMVLRE